MPGFVDTAAGDFGIADFLVFIPLPDSDTLLTYHSGFQQVQATLGTNQGINTPLDAAAPLFLPLP